MSWHSPDLNFMNRWNQIAHTIQLCYQRHKQFPLNSQQCLQILKMDEFHRVIKALETDYMRCTHLVPIMLKTKKNLKEESFKVHLICSTLIYITTISFFLVILSFVVWFWKMFNVLKKDVYSLVVGCRICICAIRSCILIMLFKCSISLLLFWCLNF